MTGMRFSVPRRLTELTGLSWEEMLTRMPPLGWAGGECPSGQLVAEAERVVAVVDRVQSFPNGVLITLAIDTGDEDIANRVQGLPTRAEMQSRMDEMHARATRGSTSGSSFNIITAREVIQRRPEVQITVRVDSGSPLRVLTSHEQSSVSAGEPLVSLHTHRSHRAPGATVLLWVHPIPESGDRLTLAIEWPQVGTPERSVDFDLEELRAAAGRARQLYEVDWEHDD